MNKFKYLKSEIYLFAIFLHDFDLPNMLMGKIALFFSFFFFLEIHERVMIWPLHFFFANPQKSHDLALAS